LYQIHIAIAIAGTKAIKAHIIGTNSIRPAIKASEKTSSIFTQNNLINKRPKNVAIKILKQRIICHLSQL